VEKTPRSEVSASLRDLNSGSKWLPWTEVIVFVTSANVQRAVGSGPDVVCSRAVNGCSGRGVRKRAIAARPVSKRLGVGGVGSRASAIAAPIRGVSGGANNPSAINNASANRPRRQLTRRRRARASAQHQRAKILRRGGANVRAATNISRSSMNIRVSVFAVWRAAWRYVACWIAKRVIGRGGDVGARPK
jgi:hypothetical protein